MLDQITRECLGIPSTQGLDAEEHILGHVRTQSGYIEGKNLLPQVSGRELSGGDERATV